MHLLVPIPRSRVAAPTIFSSVRSRGTSHHGCCRRFWRRCHDRRCQRVSCSDLGNRSSACARGRCRRACAWSVGIVRVCASVCRPDVRRARWLPHAHRVVDLDPRARREGHCAAHPAAAHRANSLPQKVVFLNPVQEYNRDLSIVAIRTWSEIKSAEDVARREKQRAKRANGPPSKKRKLNGAADVRVSARSQALRVQPAQPEAGPSAAPIADEASAPLPPYRFTVFEALSATGLRAIRYAKELPLLKRVESPLALTLTEQLGPGERSEPLGRREHPRQCRAQRHGAARSGPRRTSERGQSARVGSRRDVRSSPRSTLLTTGERSCTTTAPTARASTSSTWIRTARRHRSSTELCKRFATAVRRRHAGSADGSGLLCVTCTDMAVLAGASYPEKACVCRTVAFPLNRAATRTTAARRSRRSTATRWPCVSC